MNAIDPNCMYSDGRSDCPAPGVLWFSYHEPTELAPRHIRAARALLGWSQSMLAAKSHVAVSTISDFERDARTPIPANARAMRAALEAAGILFLPTGVLIGPDERWSDR